MVAAEAVVVCVELCEEVDSTKKSESIFELIIQSVLCERFQRVKVFSLNLYLPSVILNLYTTQLLCIPLYPALFLFTQVGD
jgi:hypothetical protein